MPVGLPGAEWQGFINNIQKSDDFSPIGFSTENFYLAEDLINPSNIKMSMIHI